MTEQRNRSMQGWLRRTIVIALGFVAIGAMLGVAGGGGAEAATPALGVPSLVGCVAGYYSPAPGVPCLPAPAGAFVAGANAVMFTLCNPGAYQDQVTQTKCKAAPIGAFVNTAGSASYTLCTSGAYQDQVGQTQCKAAPAGGFTESPGATAPTWCTPGHYQPAAGKQGCLSAAPGSSVALAKATSSVPCAPGSYQPYEGTASCTPASVGFYVPQAGATQQLTCPPSTTSGVGSTACTPVVGPPKKVPLLVPVAPFRMADTRTAARVGSADGTAAPLKVHVTGRGGVPATGIAAASLNITVVDGHQPTIGGGYVTVDACNTPRPDASNLNFSAGQTIPNAVITPVSATGDVCIYVYGDAHILVDLNGYFPVSPTS